MKQEILFVLLKDFADWEESDNKLINFAFRIPLISIN